MPGEVAPKRMVGIFLFELETGKMPNLELLARQVSELLAGLSCGWHVIYYPPAGSAPPSPPAKRWAVKVAVANLRGGPGVSFPILGQVKMGETLVELEVQTGWMRTDRGWINLNLCVPEKAK